LGTHRHSDDQLRYDAGGGTFRVRRFQGGTGSKLCELRKGPRRNGRDRQYPGAGRADRNAWVLSAR
jgi:hypothetical protein